MHNTSIKSDNELQAGIRLAPKWRKRMRFHQVVLGLGIAVVPNCLHAASHTAFVVRFANCSEFVASGTTSLAAAKAVVPAGYTIVEASPGLAYVAVRTTSCVQAQVNRTKALPTIITQIGIALVSPDGTGDSNTYVLIYVSNNPFLAQAFKRAGTPARFDPELAYDYTLNSAGTGGTFYGASQHAGVPAFFMYGEQTEPPPHSGYPYLANWWYGANQAVKEATNFPVVSAGTSAVTIYTSLASPLSLLLGGNSYSNFTLYDLHNEYPAATMVVTVQGP